MVWCVRILVAIMRWIWQESEKTKMSSGGSAIIIGYSEGE